MTCRTMPNLEDIDQALNMYVKNETVEIIDEYEQTWHPVFKVSFKKSNG